MAAKTVEEEALSLPPEKRARLAKRLLASLDDLSASEIEDLWLAEAEQRACELDRGEVKPLSCEEVRRRARSLRR